MAKKYIIALDEGTTSARALIYDTVANKISGVVNHPIKQIYPNPGWVEHDPEEIWEAQLSSLKNVLKENDISLSEVYCIGITNQRETVVVWNKFTLKPIYNAIVWQCRRTADYCNEMRDYEEVIKTKTGLKLDAYFSATKIKWILDNVEGARLFAERGELVCGTIDTYLVCKLTKGKSFVTDYSNASRTMLYNIYQKCWDEDLLNLFDIPINILPKVVDSGGFVGNAELDGYSIPIYGVIGDQQSALFGQACFDAGMAKNTYGTGCFMLLNTGEKPICGGELLSTIAWGINGKITYALEGSIFNAGSCVQWLRDELGVIEKSSDTEELCFSVADTNGVYFVPAFTGLGAPYWDMGARGTIVGITRGVTKAHIVRAGMESMAYNTLAILQEMVKISGVEIKELRCDGGVSKDNFLMQFQADLLNKKVAKQASSECTALGAVYLSGLAAGVFKSFEEISEKVNILKYFMPNRENDNFDHLFEQWQKAVLKSKNWV